MELQIKPDPEERELLAAAAEALLRLDPLPPAYRSAWRAQGVRENIEEPDEGQGEAGRPRSSPGATLA